jgi:hypothetical protein
MNNRTIFVSFFILTILFYACSTNEKKSENIVVDSIPIISKIDSVRTPSENIKEEETGKQEISIRFQEIEIIFDSLMVWDNKKEFFETLKNIKKDSVYLWLDIGGYVENETFTVKPSKDISIIKVEQSFQTSMTIQEEGPHTDLLDWKHYVSDWKIIKASESGTYVCLSYSEEDSQRFPKVTLEEVKKAVFSTEKEMEWLKTEKGKEWLKFLDDDYPYGTVMISHYFIKVTAVNNITGEKISKILIFEVPMGC